MRHLLSFMFFACTCLSAPLHAVDTVVQPAAPNSPLLEARSQVLHDALIGNWRSRIGDQSLVIIFKHDGSLFMGTSKGQWRISPDGKVILSVNNVDENISANINNGQLSLSGGSLAQAQVFNRDPGLSDFMIGWMGIESSSTSHRFFRLIAIFIWISIARFIIWIIQHIGQGIINSKWGPFRWVFPQRPSRASTILSLILNTGKYIMYGIGLGFILSTFDVDYTTYLASLSVIGLAIGFGSQGLVQDMVTGIFILLESQFDVGDMIELSGQIGIVKEMGLRMTRVQTIQGQSVTIPNRTIGTVACYGQDGLRVEVSAKCTNTEQADEVALIIGKTIEAFADQFRAAVLEHEHCRIDQQHDSKLIRCDIHLWPGQQALLDQQLLPRLRSALPAETFVDCASTIAWHFDRPKKQLGLRKGFSDWLGQDNKPAA